MEGIQKSVVLTVTATDIKANPRIYAAVVNPE